MTDSTIMRLPTGTGTNDGATAVFMATGLMSDHERGALKAECETPRRVAADDRLVVAGERPSHLLILTEGWAIRCVRTANGARQILAILLPGNVCNLDAMLVEHAPSEVRMLTSGRVVPVPIERACALGREHQGIARAYLWLAFREQHRLARTALSLGRQSARERLANLLCGLAHRLGTGDFDFPVTQDQLADALGVTNIHVCRVLGELRRDGLVRTDNRRMVLLEETVLRNIGAFEPEAELGPAQRGYAHAA